MVKTTYILLEAYMKEVCIINRGENKEKITYSMGLKFNDNSSEYIIFDNLKCVTMTEGSDDITIVRNYQPYFLKHVKNTESMLDIYALGFQMMGGESSEHIVLRKSSGIKYSVKPLEKIEDIAKKFGVTIKYIIENNSLVSEKLFVGQVLLI